MQSVPQPERTRLGSLEAVDSYRREPQGKHSMEKGVNSGLFVNDGSFMERFKQLQQEKQEKTATKDSNSGASMRYAVVSKPGDIGNKRPLDIKVNDPKKPGASASNGKLAFSLKQKSKIAVAPVKLAEDEEGDRGETKAGISDEPTKRQKLVQTESSGPSLEHGNASSPPSDPIVRKVADRLASFVAKNGRQFEDVTCQKNPGDTPFKFLFDPSCSDYKYYAYRLIEEEKLLAQTKDSRASFTTSPTTSRVLGVNQMNPIQQHSNYQTPASALYEVSEYTRSNATLQGRTPINGESSRPPAADPIAMMEYYMKKAAQEERKRPSKQSKDEMAPPASVQAPIKKGHHMGDYIPPEELEKFLATCNDAAAQKTAREAAEKAKIQADNIGHKLLSKMGWKEGEGLGSSKSGRADPVMAGNVKLNNLGVGAHHPGEVTPDDDIYEQYKKRMMLGYRYRPNPLNNPRKAYY